MVLNQCSQRQLGRSLFTWLWWLALVVIAAQLLIKVLPAVLEYRAVTQAVQLAAQSTAQTPAQVRIAFDRAASLEDIQALSGKDLEIRQGGDKWRLDSAYQREIHLLGIAYLTLKYTGHSQ